MSSLRILLIDVNRISIDTSLDMLEYPIGLVYVATALKQALGDRVEVEIRSYNDKVDSEQTVRAWLDQLKPEIVGLRALTMGRGPLHAIADLARALGVPLVVAGGPHATDSPRDVLANASFDCAVIGEGEETMVELVQRFLADEPLSEVEGLAVRTPGGAVQVWRRPLIADLAALPAPDHRLVDFQGINSGHVDFSFRYNTPHANLFTSRGCPYRCIYCHQMFGKRYRGHSAARIMEEIRTLHDDFGITQFQIIDDIFNIDKRRAMALFESIARSGLKLVLSFPHAVRGDLVDAELVDAMWEAGVRYVAYAVETASPRLQELIKKKLDLDRIAEAIRLSTAKGIVTRGFFMIGFPSETEEEAKLTVEFAKSSDLVLSLFFNVVYFPGTELHRLARDLTGFADLDLGLEDDYVRTREGPYAFSRAALEELKRRAIREFFFSPRRIDLFFDKMPNFYAQRDIDASMLGTIISCEMKEAELEDEVCRERLHRYFLIASRFSNKSGFFV
jgi:anaerobic magnesium-protoporphyrin IX monomethyl ester cyclase